MDARRQAIVEMLARSRGKDPAASAARAALGPAPASYAQRRFWLLDQLSPGNPLYHVPMCVRLSGNLHRGALERSLNALIERHEILRTHFEAAGGRLIQIVAPELRIPLVEREIPGSDGGSGPPLEEVLCEEARRPFDLARGPLLRPVLIRLGAEEHVFLLTLHHSVCDAWSVGVLMRDVAAFYAALVAGVEPDLPALPLQYRDYALWQQEALPSLLSRELVYWRGVLGDQPAAATLPAERPRPATRGFLGRHRAFGFGPELTAAAARFARQEGATLFMLLLASFQAVLHRYSEERAIVVGTAIANRRRREFEQLIGPFANTLALRTEVRGDLSFRQVVRHAKQTALGAYTHQDVPFERLLEDLRPERDGNRTPLFQTMLVLQNVPRVRAEFPGLALAPLDVRTGTSKFDLTALVWQDERGAEGVIEYDAELFERPRIERFVEHWTNVLASGIRNPGQPVGTLPLMGPGERSRVDAAACGPIPASQGADSVSELFARQAARQPDAVALCCEGHQLSYAELNRRAGRLAQTLRRFGIGAERVVGICLERSVEMITAVLGVLAAGAAYLPVDPSHPTDRRLALLSASGVQVAIAERNTASVLAAAGLPVLCPGENGQMRPPEGSSLRSPRPAPRVTSAHRLAYVLFTSGSTGEPKGVMVEHAQLSNYVQAVLQQLRLTDAARFALIQPFTVDASVTTLFGALCSGGCLHLVPDEVAADGRLLAAYCRSRGIDYLKAAPSHLEALLNAAEAPGDWLPRRHLIMGGEAAAWNWAVRVRALAPPTCAMINQYGPTETTVGILMYGVEAGEGAPDRREITPIGRPLANTRVQVLSAGGELVPLCVPGELYAAGGNVSRGYLGRPDLTAESFLPDPSAPQPGGVRYRTGDRVCYLEDGNVAFLGRLDEQIKVRGFRVEPAEIEAALRQHPAVREAAVVSRRDTAGHHTLAACVVPGAATLPAAGELRAFLATRLPQFMLPATFVELASLPRTPHGKVDRRALAHIDLPRFEDQEVYVAPRDATEEILAGIWMEVLGTRQPISIHGDFFDLGGHSLLAMQIIPRIRAAFHREVGVGALFEDRTVARLAARIVASARIAPDTPIPRGVHGPAPPLSYAQERLWFLQRLWPGMSAYNAFTALRLSGALDRQALEAAVNEVVRRHDALRTHFEARDGAPVQIVEPEARIPLETVDPGGESDPEVAEAALRTIGRQEAERPFALDRAPLLRAGLARLSPRDHVLLLTLHHLICDGWSMGVFLRELRVCYGEYACRRVPALPELPIQYADYAVWQRGWLTGALLEGQLDYWRRRLSGNLPPSTLPADHPRPAAPRFRGGHIGLPMGAELTAALQRMSRSEAVTLYMTLLAALQALLHRYTGQEDIVVGAPVANRTRPELEPLIGFFANTLALRGTVRGEDSFRDLLGQTRAVTLEAYANQDVPFERVVEELRPDRDLSRNPLFQIMLVLQNAPMPELELPGLKMRVLDVDSGTAKFDLLLALAEGPDGIHGVLEYDSDIFERSSMAAFAERYRSVLRAVAADPGIRVRDLSLLGDGEREQLLARCRPAVRAIH